MVIAEGTATKPKLIRNWEMGSNQNKEFICFFFFSLRGTHKAKTGEEWKHMNRKQQESHVWKDTKPKD